MTATKHEDLALRYLLDVPSGADDTAELPLVVMMHGRGADAFDLADVAPMLDGGYRWIFPNAPKPFAAYPGMNLGWTWFDGWPPEEASVSESRQMLLAFLDAIIARYPTTPGKIIIAGFSQGGMMSLELGLRTAAKISGIVVLSGGLYEQNLPDLTTHKELPIFIGHGSLDDVVPLMFAQRARRVLEGAGLDVEYHEYPMGHQLVQEEAAALKAFLGRVLA
ncbi:MAG TPA: alpha/beta fold hydrolase [Thermoanaerobaculia bacterium]|nr:alpha/beta fold hydrolase [Thermoanaerobaculia bacterium]